MIPSLPSDRLLSRQSPKVNAAYGTTESRALPNLEKSRLTIQRELILSQAAGIFVRVVVAARSGTELRARRVVWLVGTLVEQPVCGYVHDGSLQARYATLIVRYELNLGIEAGMNHIDVLGPEARGHDETVLPGHQVHERSARSDDAAGRMNP